MSAGWTPQVSSRASCLPEATGRCQRLSASVCHRSPVSTDSASTPLRLCRSEFPSGLWSETPRQCNWPHILFSVLCLPSLTTETQQTQGHGVCHVSPCGFECKWCCVGVGAWKPGCVTLSVHRCTYVRARVRLFLSDSVSEVQPGGGAL